MQCVGFSCPSSCSCWRRPAQASTPEIGIADDRVLMPGGAGRRRGRWRSGRPWASTRCGSSPCGRGSLRRASPRGFRAEDPNDPHYQWFLLDLAIDRVRAAGMTRDAHRHRPRTGVDERVAGAPAGPVEAAARRRTAPSPRPWRRRYGSRVDRYILWNEPNISIWLSPQARCRKGRCTPVSPHLYRRARARRLPGDRRPRPGRGDRDRRAVAARSAAAEREHGDAAAAVPAPPRLPHRRLAAHDHRRVPRLQARRPATASRSTPTAAARRPSARTPTPTTSAWPRSAR